MAAAWVAQRTEQVAAMGASKAPHYTFWTDLGGRVRKKSFGSGEQGKMLAEQYAGILNTDLRMGRFPEVTLWSSAWDAFVAYCGSRDTVEALRRSVPDNRADMRILVKQALKKHDAERGALIALLNATELKPRCRECGYPFEPKSKVQVMCSKSECRAAAAKRAAEKQAEKYRQATKCRRSEPLPPRPEGYWNCRPCRSCGREFMSDRGMSFHCANCKPQVDADRKHRVSSLGRKYRQQRKCESLALSLISMEGELHALD